MSYKYQIWKRSELNEAYSNPLSTVYSIDMAMIKAAELSKNSEITVVIDKSSSASRIRGFGINGVWKDSVENCKSCKNTSRNFKDCPACNSASWKPF